ncbi:MAG: hypothetical protein ACI8ZO_000989 [Flavobacteriales bacterium]|jgi:hypothetical protein
MLHFKKFILSLTILLACFQSFGAKILIPMDENQKNHLKAYGIAFWVLQNDLNVQWLLNYRGGSFMIDDYPDISKECIIRGVSYEKVADVQAVQILQEISRPEVNMDMVILEKSPKIAVYSPKNKLPWDDAVTLALTYAEIPYDIIYDDEVLGNLLPLYDWLHLHHEDFTGQYGRFYSAYKNAPWYIDQQQSFEESAKAAGFEKVSEHKLAVAKEIKAFVVGGGFMFAMCSATDSYDIALASQNTDICAYMFDGDPADPAAQSKLDFSQTIAFKDFKLESNPNQYEFSSIDATRTRRLTEKNDFFSLFEFSAKWDQIPSMLCQNHTQIIPGFMGQTTAFLKNQIKSEVLIMGENKVASEARYIHGELGKGTWTWYGGHDPEDYSHRVGDPPTDLDLHPNSPGYRLILNNVLFPAARKKKQKT